MACGAVDEAWDMAGRPLIRPVLGISGILGQTRPTSANGSRIASH